MASPFFVVEHLAGTEPLLLSADAGRTSAQVLVAIEGGAVVEWEGVQPVSFNRGDCVVIPAEMAAVRVRPQWTVELLRMRLPGEPLPPPAVIPPADCSKRSESTKLG